ncbi:amidase signature enzyme, partial [Hysterangium stoloniferum]
PLLGLRIAIKDNICTRNFPTTCASNMLKDFQPGYNATVVDILEQSGAIIVGKTNLDEFGMGSSNIHSAFGPVINPAYANWLDGRPVGESLPPTPSGQDRVAGGSSGGSAAAVKSGQCFAALSTDTGGSTRLPAAYCGVAGFKPSYGLLSRWGVIPFADSLDTVGIISEKAADIHKVFKHVSKFDEKDPTCVPLGIRLRAENFTSRYTDRFAPRNSSTNQVSLGRLRIGIPHEYFPAELNPSLLKSFRAILENLKSRGATLFSVSLPHTPYALSAYYVLASAEASSNLARYDGVRYGYPQTNRARTADVYAESRTEGFGLEVQKRVILGTHALTADAYDNYYLQAQRIRRHVCDDFDRVFRSPNLCQESLEECEESHAPQGPHVDVLLHLSAIQTAPRVSEVSSQGIEAYVQDALTVPASLAGVPALSVPIGLAEDGWPIGASVVGQWGHDELVLRVGETLMERG